MTRGQESISAVTTNIKLKAIRRSWKQLLLIFQEKEITMKVIESDDGMYATVVLEDADAEEMDEEFVKEFIRVAESQKQHFEKGDRYESY